MPSYPLPTLGPTITPEGITAPSYNDIYQSLIASFQGIYGSDIYIDPDSQDGQWLAVLATGYNDANQACIAIYQSFSPSYAQGTQLSSQVKLNGLTRAVPTNSQANGNVIGQAGVTVTNGVVKDVNGNLWNMPPTVNIPIGGEILVTVTAQSPGNITAAIGDINIMYNPQFGWQSFSNTTAAIPGAPLELDAGLRTRQATAASLPTTTILAGIQSTIQSLSGVTQCICYENPTSSTDGRGLPPHSISVVTEGGSATDIATVIANLKTQGCDTYGTTTEQISNVFGVLEAINFYVVQQVRIIVAVSLTPINGYTTTIGQEIQTSIANYINSLAIGSSVLYTRVYPPALLSGNTDGLTYELNSLQIAIFGNALGQADIPISFFQEATCQPSDVTITVL